ncbi:MAG TPA: tRNA (adenosine(37)-N6)-threonylcarbamoyltransferase complex transferase subunit TsaD [Candidatus Paceibacterota bacterium]|nr:tRNA (adenosine(37)-N6)-threonylcarbamoyltransferase complex transferase subunit TsaD [Candidatus Paceibacterota bacterium]
MRILGIETSADETGVSLIEADGAFGADFSFKTLGNSLASQTETHARFGGIFPNMAAREHQKNLVPLLHSTLEQAGLLHPGSCAHDISGILVRESDLAAALDEFLAHHTRPDIDCIAVTHGPGLEPTLWVGINCAKALASAWRVPLVPVNHMEGHILISAVTNGALSRFSFPLLSLLISGGHTELVLSEEWMRYKLLGQTRDDAVGEAFDKVARLFGLPYPGGPQISRLATELRRRNVAPNISLPRPMIDSDDYDFSFAGLKTAVRRIVEANQPLSENMKKEIALEFENACADVLIAKTMRAIEEYGAETVLIGGGVSANVHIRAHLAETIANYGTGTKLLVPPPELATDNALMIALAGYFRAQKNKYAEPASIRADGTLSLAT